MSASRGANDHTRTDNSRQPLDPKTAHPTDAAHAFCSSALFRAVASPASRLANDWSAVVCSTSAGAYSGLHHTCIAGSNLSLSSLYALLKPPVRAGLFSRYHWYPVGGLLLVLAHSRPAFRSHTRLPWLPPRTNSNSSHLCLHQCPLAIVMRCETTTHRKMHHDLQ
jgi:hypothetical protein